MIKIAFVGDIMLGRFVGAKYHKTHYKIVDQNILNRIEACDFTVANLESPIFVGNSIDYDSLPSLTFLGRPEILGQFKWVDLFSLSNNHINDAGKSGMDETISSLDAAGIKWNGLYKESYVPFVINQKNEKVAIITCTDLINTEFDETNEWKTLRIDSLELDESIKECKRQGYYTILYAHVGMLFSRFPSKSVRDILHSKIDMGADMIVTVHPHVIGGIEHYKGAPIVYSLGDFVMDGGSYRRRRSVMLEVMIEDGKNVTDFDTAISNCIINDNLTTEYAGERVQKRMRKSWAYVTRQIAAKERNYLNFYRRQYRVEMLQHSLSTLSFQFKSRGVLGMLKILISRADSVWMMFKRLLFGRGNQRYDSDAVPPEGKDISLKNIK